MKYRVFSAGDCPVCPGFGAVLILAARAVVVGKNRLVFFCPACGCAWRSAPGDRFDEANRLREVAPDGVRLPDEAELRSSGALAMEVDSVPWESDLDEILASGPAD